MRRKTERNADGRAAGASSLEALARRVPKSVGASTLIGLLVIAAIFGGAGTWGATAPLSGAVLAGGVLTSEQRRRQVQHLEGGVIAEIAVRDGDAVRSGDLLIRLSDARARATLSIVDGALRNARALEARLLAERAGRAEVAFPDDLTADPSPETQALLAATRDVFRARAETRAGAEEILRQRIAQLEREIEGLAAQADAKAGQRDLILEEIAGVQSLFDEGQATKARLLSLKRARLQLDGEAGELTAAIARTRKAVGETRLEIIQRELDFASAVARELEEAQTRMRDLRERAIAARDVLERLDIRAPADGVVVGRTVNTVGAVARPGETLMEIVPSDERLYVEVRIQPQDRDDVYAGQNADIRLIAFNQRTTPLVSGSVAYVSADALADPAGQGTFYTGRIALAEGTDPKLAEALTPGMPAEVLIKTEARTAFEYLARPILDSLNRAWRES